VLAVRVEAAAKRIRLPYSATARSRARAAHRMIQPTFPSLLRSLLGPSRLYGPPHRPPCRPSGLHWPPRWHQRSGVLQRGLGSLLDGRRSTPSRQ
jgi:hypothetical protein